MLKNLFQTIRSFILLIFYFPYFLVRTSIGLFKLYVLKDKLPTQEGLKPKYAFLTSVIIWVCIISFNVYQNQFYYIDYVFACPLNSSSDKCYRVQADYVPEECADDEYGRGIIKGKCLNPYYSKIYFNNGGYKTFETCYMLKKDNWNCETEEGDMWLIQFAERIKLKIDR